MGDFSRLVGRVLSFLAVSLYHGPFDQSSYRFWSFRAVFGAGFLVNQNGSTQNAPLNINPNAAKIFLPRQHSSAARLGFAAGARLHLPGGIGHQLPNRQCSNDLRAFTWGRARAMSSDHGSSCFEGTLWLGFEGKARGKPLGRCVGSPKKTHPKEFVAELCAQFTTKLSRNVPRLPREAKLRGKANHHVHSSRQRNPHMALTTV